MSKKGKSFSKYGVICGAGIEPLKIVKKLSESGFPIFVIKISGEADADYTNFTHTELKLGQLNKMVKELKDAGCTELVLSGKINNLSLLSTTPDFSALTILAQKGRLGDNNLLQKVSSFFTKKGFNIVSQDKISPRDFLPKDYKFGLMPSKRILDDIKIGVSYLEQSSSFDIGQSLIIQAGRLIAIEAGEGTDEMIKRSATLVDKDRSPAIFIKMAKKNQSLKHDLPVFGLNTVKQLHASNISYVCLHAKNCKLAVSLSDIETAISKIGISLYSVDYG